MRHVHLSGIAACAIAFAFSGSVYAAPPTPNVKCAPAMTFTFDPGTTVQDGTMVILTEDVTVAAVGAGSLDCGVAVGGHVNDGQAQIQQVVLGTVPMTCSDIGKSYCTVGQSSNADGTCATSADCDAGVGTCTSVTTIQIAMENHTSDGILSASVDTTGYGGKVLGFLARYVGQGSYSNADTVCTDLTVSASACSGATISIERSSGTGAPVAGSTNNNWTYEVSVHACEKLYGVTAQGGTNGWAPLAGATTADTGSAVIRNNNKKNQVLLWTIGDMEAGTTAHLTVPLAGSIPNGAPDCQLRYLSGPWSAMFSTDGLFYTKSDYTGRVTVNVDSNGDGNPTGCAAP